MKKPTIGVGDCFGQVDGYGRLISWSVEQVIDHHGILHACIASVNDPSRRKTVALSVLLRDGSYMRQEALH
ncbi:hypothetical protein [Oceanibaculum nanhaiense]|uniref:hypothetical protein n=1 Tax=Oceanibaculum nanhaiense TaxID=1909734 RepID=UPI003D280AB9